MSLLQFLTHNSLHVFAPQFFACICEGCPGKKINVPGSLFQMFFMVFVPHKKSVLSRERFNWFALL